MPGLPSGNPAQNVYDDASLLQWRRVRSANYSPQAAPHNRRSLLLTPFIRASQVVQQVLEAYSDPVTLRTSQVVLQVLRTVAITDNNRQSDWQLPMGWPVRTRQAKAMSARIIASDIPGDVLLRFLESKDTFFGAPGEVPTHRWHNPRLRLWQPPAAPYFGILPGGGVITPIAESYTTPGTAHPGLRAYGATARDEAQIINALLAGWFNCTIDVTLAVGGTTSVVSDPRIGASSWCWAMPMTASAAAGLSGMSVATTSKQMTITHSISAATDRIFRFAILGG